MSDEERKNMEELTSNNGEDIDSLADGLSETAGTAGVSIEGQSEPAEIEEEKEFLCLNCGSKIADSQKFCPMCGTPKGVDKKRTCSKCGAVLENGQQFCPQCGKKVATESAVKAANVGEKGRKKKRLIAIGVGALVIIALVLVMILTNEDNGKKSNTYSSYSSSSSSYSSTEMSHGTYCLLYMHVSDVKIKHERNYTYCTGTVSNDGTYRIKFVQVKGVFKDASGKIVDTDWTYAVGNDWLDAGERVTFEMMIRDEDGRIKDADVSVVYDD